MFCKKMSSLCAPVKVEIKLFTESLTNIVLVRLMKFSLPHLWYKVKNEQFLTTAHALLDKPAATECQLWQTNAYRQQSRY